MGQAGGAARITASLAGNTMVVVGYGAETPESLQRGPLDVAASSPDQVTRGTTT